MTETVPATYHTRKQIREAMVGAVWNLRTTGDRVHEARVYPLAENALPCLVVYTERETSEAATLEAEPLMERQLEIIIEGHAAASDDLEDVLDGIASEVETAVASHRGLKRLGITSILTNTEVNISPEGDKPHGIIRMAFECRYYAHDPQSSRYRTPREFGLQILVPPGVWTQPPPPRVVDLEQEYGWLQAIFQGTPHGDPATRHGNTLTVQIQEADAEAGSWTNINPAMVFLMADSRVLTSRAISPEVVKRYIRADTTMAGPDPAFNFSLVLARANPHTIR